MRALNEGIGDLDPEMLRRCDEGNNQSILNKGYFVVATSYPLQPRQQVAVDTVNGRCVAVVIGEATREEFESQQRRLFPGYPDSQILGTEFHDRFYKLTAE